MVLGCLISEDVARHDRHHWSGLVMGMGLDGCIFLRWSFLRLLFSLYLVIFAALGH
jgi:hypothetical protein